MRASALLLLLCLAIVCGCNREPGSRVLVRGTLKVQADEAVFRAMENECAEFQSLYPDAKLSIAGADAREAISNFAADSVEVIVTAREFNKEERDALSKGKVVIDEYKVAMSAVAVITNPRNPIDTTIRLSQLDSIFSGKMKTWPRGGIIDPLAGGRESSTNEVFRTTVMGGRDFGPYVSYIDSSSARIRRVAETRNAIAIVAVDWLKGTEGKVTVLRVGSPEFRPDSTMAAGQYYDPCQAYVFLGYYPINTPVYIYSRVQDQDVSLGFIAFVCSGPGQKIIQNNGLVPVTMPVRLVSLTSQQVR